MTPRTVRRWAEEGRIERIRLGGRLVRYTPEAVEALLLILPLNETDPAGSRAGRKATDDAVNTEA